jgi:glycosyltransferase involved in cell wall biosynthesis
MFTVDGSLAAQQGCETDDYIVVEPPLDTLGCGRIDVDNPPKVSFCIPTLNNERTIGSCLESIASQNYPETEIVIVDGGSSDRTIEIVGKYTDNVQFDDGALGSARQTSLDHSTGEVVALFDSDVVIPHRGWLQNAIQYFNYSERVSTVWPVVVAPPNAPWTARLYANMWRSTMENRINARGSVLGGGNALFLRPCIERIGGINRSLHWGEDFDWAQKLKDQSYQVVLIRDVLYHDTMNSLKQFARKQFAGAETFRTAGFETTGRSKTDVLYEQFILGAKNMTWGLLRERDNSWILYPLFVLIRVIAYGSTYLKGTTTDDR